MFIFPVQLENVRRIVIYFLTMAVHEHYVIIQYSPNQKWLPMKIGEAKHNFALHCAASKHIIFLQNGKYNAYILLLHVKPIAPLVVNNRISIFPKPHF